MTTTPRFLTLLAILLAEIPVAIAQIQPAELVAPKLEISGGNLNFTLQPSVSGRNYQLQCSDTMAPGSWQNLGVERSGDGTNLVISTPYAAEGRKRYYRVALVEAPAAPDGFALISAGSFTMGDQSSPQVGYSDELPVHSSVNVSAFYMARHEVAKALWDEVATWAEANGYDINAAGASGKGTNHPAYNVTWYECVKWCNARSRKENLTPCYTVSGVEYKSGNSAPDCNWNANGYRLPTDAEWTKAARGGLVGKRFPWGDVISHSEANFNNDGGEAYQTGTIGYHPTYATGGTPHTSPAGSFAANGYGLYDMTGNVWEWCWDWAGTNASGEQTDPRGASSGSLRVGRGGCWYSLAYYCRVAYRYDRDPTYPDSDFGFRVARSAVP